LDVPIGRLVKITLRDAKETDAPSVADLLTELGYPTDTDGAAGRLRSAFADPNVYVLVSEADGRVVGFLSAQVAAYFPTGSNLLRVTALAVSAAARRRGLGSGLLARAAEIAAARDCSGIEITTSESRHDAHAFYERLGFSRSSLRFFRSVGHQVVDP